MGAQAANPASFEVQDHDRSLVSGSLDFNTVGRLLPVGSEAIGRGRATVLDLAGVTASDSAGLALLIEWLSVARASRRSLNYENVPLQLQQLARLSEVEELLMTA